MLIHAVCGTFHVLYCEGTFDEGPGFLHDLLVNSHMRSTKYDQGWTKYFGFFELERKIVHVQRSIEVQGTDSIF